MDNSAKKQKLFKTLGIVLGGIMIVFVGLILISKRPQTAGKGSVDAWDFNLRIDYRDEMNCSVGNKKDENRLDLSATDGWEKIAVENYQLGDERAMIQIVDGIVYAKTDNWAATYNLDYFNYEFGIDFAESLKLAMDDTRKISCGSQQSEKYLISEPRKYENFAGKRAPDETK